jgi:tetratricopeptide (TPR) repeat protein
MKGKISYMSPEQARGEGLDRRSDIFSLGVVFYELLTYRKLFEGESELQILEGLKDPHIEPPSRLNPDIPIELDRIVLKALARKPQNRYQSAEEMFNQCETFLASRGDFPTTNGFRNFLRIILRDDIEREEREIQEEYDRVGSFEINQEKTHPFTLRSTSPTSNEQSLFSLGLGLFGRLKHTAAITGALVLVFFLFLSFIPTPSQTIKKVPTADDHVRYALFCFSQARFDRALAEFEKAFKMEPSYVNRYRKQLARVFLERGKANLPGSLEMAIRDIKEARRLDPGNHEAYFQLGRALAKSRRYDEALDQYEQSIAIMPENPDAHFNLGYIFLGRKEYASAAREFEEVIKLKPPYLSDAYVNLGIARCNAGQLEEALIALKKAFQLNPKNGSISAYIDAVKAQLRKRRP